MFDLYRHAIPEIDPTAIDNGGSAHLKVR